MNWLKKLFVSYPLISWNIIGIICSAYIGSGWVLFLFFMISILFYVRHSKKVKQQKIFINKQENLDEARSYISKISIAKALPITFTSLMLGNGENAFLDENAKLMETRSIREWRSTGGRVRVMKGLSIGQSAGRSESHKEWRTIDTGQLVLTNKKIVFNGSKESRIMPLDKIVKVTPMLDAIEISLTTKSSSMVFPVKNPYLWATVIRIVSSVENPLALGELNVDVKIQ